MADSASLAPPACLAAPACICMLTFCSTQHQRKLVGHYEVGPLSTRSTDIVRPRLGWAYVCCLLVVLWLRLSLLP